MSNNLDVNWVDIKFTYIYDASSPSMATLAKKFGVSVGAIGDRAKRENWVELRSKHRAEVEQRVDTKIVSMATKQRLRHIKILETMINYGAKGILQRLKENKMQLNVADIDRLMRLWEIKNNNGRVAKDVNIILTKPLSEMTDEELANAEREAQSKTIEAEYSVVENEADNNSGN